jgi:NADH dehydrogenase [ubiquinone] 1 alpha subcomplex assembly factor 7
MLETHIIKTIQEKGPLSQSQFMEIALQHPQHGYYQTHEAVGQDFTTSPEISQVFGELIGAWALDYFIKLNRPSPLTLVELGPGKGTLFADLLRVANLDPSFAQALDIYLVETSPLLKEQQKTSISCPLTWLENFEELPKSQNPFIIIANEFFDALPTNLFKRKDNVVFERCITHKEGWLSFIDIERRQEIGPDKEWEESPQTEALLHAICKRLQICGGAFLCIDYGYEDGSGDTLQALYRREPSPPLQQVGRSDLTCHVNFSKLKEIARSYNLGVLGPSSQGQFLKNLGIDTRIEFLKKKNPSQGASLNAALTRLTHPQQMGTLFKVITIFSPLKPSPSGFDLCV